MFTLDNLIKMSIEIILSKKKNCLNFLNFGIIDDFVVININYRLLLVINCC